MPEGATEEHKNVTTKERNEEVFKQVLVGADKLAGIVLHSSNNLRGLGKVKRNLVEIEGLGTIIMWFPEIGSEDVETQFYVTICLNCSERKYIPPNTRCDLRYTIIKDPFNPDITQDFPVGTKILELDIYDGSEFPNGSSPDDPTKDSYKLMVSPADKYSTDKYLFETPQPATRGTEPFKQSFQYLMNVGNVDVM